MFLQSFKTKGERRYKKFIKKKFGLVNTRNVQREQMHFNGNLPKYIKEKIKKKILNK